MGRRGGEEARRREVDGGRGTVDGDWWPTAKTEHRTPKTDLPKPKT
jgi:hypothetical protein